MPPLARINLALACCVVILALSKVSCGPSTADGTTRPFSKTSRAGVVSVEGTEIFQDGEWVKHGAFVFYDDAGDEIARGSYKDGLEDGPWRITYEEDGATGVGSYLDGSRTGLWQTFHSNGKLQDTGEYERGLRTGLWISYKRDGTKLREARYEGGEVVGEPVWFDGRK